MQVEESLKYLNENGYICEFLTQFFKPDLVMDRIYKDLDLVITNERTYKGNPGGYFIFVDETKNKAELKKLKEKITNIVTSFNYTCNIIDLKDGTFKVGFCNASSLQKDTIYEPNSNFRIFLHGSNAGPDIIKRTGIRPKLALDNYDPRVYMESLDLLDYRSYDQIANDLADEESLENGYNIHHYVIKLPEYFKIYRDPEGFSECNWVYTKQAVPPQYILYLGQGGTLYDDDTGDETEVETKMVATEKEILDFIKK